MMKRTGTLRNCLTAAGIFAMLLVLAPTPARAASKEMIELQAQVQQLLDNVQRLQSTLDARFGVLQNLAQQTADNATQMNATVSALQQKIAAQNDAVSGKLDSNSGQVQAVNDSVDELKSRISKLDKSIQDLQTQLQNIQNPSTTAAGPAPFPATRGLAPASSSPAAAIPVDQTPPLEGTLQAAVRDYNAAKYEVASSEFQDVIHYYPLDDHAGTAEFYVGEIAYRQKNYPDAVKAYNAVLESFPGNAKAPAAQLRKGLALMQLGKKDAGIHELRSLVQRHPQTPEAAQARARLNAMGVKPAAAH